MLAAEYTPMVESQKITSNCLIRVQGYTLSVPNNAKKILCVTQMEVVKSGEEVGQRLGEPVPLKFDEAATTPGMALYIPRLTRVNSLTVIT